MRRTARRYRPTSLAMAMSESVASSSRTRANCWASVRDISVITQIEGLVYEAFEGQAFGTDGARWNGLPNSRSHRL
jgi:hypothetical protein